MENQISAGTKVKVAVTQKGVTTLQDAEVLAHMDGLVHVDLNGEAVSVDPSQIVMGDTAGPHGSESYGEMQARIEGERASQTIRSDAKIDADLIAGLTAHLHALESRVLRIENKLQIETGLEPEQSVDAAAPAASDSANHEESTAVAGSGESVAGS